MLKLQNPKPFTMHDKDYYEVWRVLDRCSEKIGDKPKVIRDRLLKELKII